MLGRRHEVRALGPCLLEPGRVDGVLVPDDLTLDARTGGEENVSRNELRSLFAGGLVGGVRLTVEAVMEAEPALKERSRRALR